MTNYYSPLQPVSFYVKKINIFVFFSFLMVSIQACQFHVSEQDVFLSDEIRNFHALELLPDHKSDEPVREFNGDTNFNDYINTYIHNHSASIDSEKLTNSILSISRVHSYDPIFLLAVIKTESKFNENAIGSVGEIGLMQIKPDTAEWICIKNNIHWRGANALKDPEYNVLVGSYYFRYLKKVLKSKSSKYITAYNMGLRAMKRSAHTSENTYFARVIENYLAIYKDLKKIKAKARA